MDPKDLWDVIATGGAVGVGLSWLVRSAYWGFDSMDTMVVWCLLGFAVLLLWCFSSTTTRGRDRVAEEDDDRQEEDPRIV